MKLIIKLFSSGSVDPLQTHHGVHGKLGVTSLYQTDFDVISTGRDGHFRRWTMQDMKVVQMSKHRAAQVCCVKEIFYKFISFKLRFILCLFMLITNFKVTIIFLGNGVVGRM